MIDINYELRKAYKAALDQTGFPVYYQELPPNISPDAYIIFRSINSSDFSTKNTFDTNTEITVEIHTKASVANSGASLDTIAGLVLGVIYPSRNINLALGNAQIVTTQLVNDVVMDWKIEGAAKWMSRYLTFSHKIFQLN
jgi:hypothetical protein